MKRFLLSEHPQGTPEWKADRAGKATGSRAADILAVIKSGEAAARRNYRVQVVTERLSGQPAEEGYVSDDMAWGTLQEPFARMAYESATGNVVQEAGFAYLSDIAAGCSVDGFVEDGGRFGLLEVKCPKTATHIDYLLGNALPSKYEPQILHNLWVTGAEFADFVSFDPRLKENLRFFCIRVERDEAKITAHEQAVLKFLAEVDELEQRLMRRAA
jgi:hypothetical protein